MKRKAGAVFFVSLLVAGTLMGMIILTSDNASAAWNVERVDFLDAVGMYTSLAFNSSGYPRISYYDFTNRNLKYARWTGTIWNIETVDSTNDVGKFSSLALATNGNPRISYLDNTANDLKYASWTGSAWNIETVDSTGNVGSDTSLALDTNGYPHISYFEFLPNYNLKYARWTGSAWNIQTVDSTGVVGEHSSIALDGNQYPHISYHDYTNWDLKYAKWTGASWSFEVVDSVGDVGDWTSLVLDSNWYPRMSYHDLTNKALKYAEWTGSAWSIQTVDSGGIIGEHTSLALTSTGYARISYYDSTGGNLKYAGWTGSAWVNETVDSTGDVGGDTSIELDPSESPCISYTDYTNSDLKYARMTEGPPNNPPNTPSTPSGPTSGVVAVSYPYSTSATDPDGDQVRYTFDWGDGNTSQTGWVASGATASQSHSWSIRGIYQVKARAEDSHGAFSGWSSSLAVTIIAPPSAPRSLAATPGDSEVALTWSPPTDAGGSPVTNCSVYRGLTSGGETLLVTIGNVLTHTDTGLTNGLTYYYKVSATNAAGEGPQSNEASATPSATILPPSAPLNLVAMAGNENVTLTWSPPSSDGGSPVTNYMVYGGTTSGGETFIASIGNVLTYLDTGLTNGVIYFYTVAAVNSAGQGLNSTEANATPMTTPTEPLGLQAAPGNGQIVLTWNAPASDGGSPITNHEVYRGLAPGAETFLVEVGNVLTYTNGGLTNGLTYYYKVGAKNVVGEGPQSNEASATPSAAILPPSAPLNLVAVAGTGNVTLVWSPPANDGGSPVVNYTVHRGIAPSGETFLVRLGNTLAHLDTGLTNGITYYYTVAAMNVAGEGPNSTEASATPMTRPTEPLNLQAAPGNGQIALTWMAPASNGGSPITNYEVYRGFAPGAETLLVEVGNVLVHQDSGLTNGIMHYYKVSAKNVVGEGALSNEASATPTAGVVPPSAPRNVAAVAGNGNVTLTWAPPSSDGGSPVTNYRIFRGTASGGEIFLLEIGGLLTHLDLGLTNGQMYYYQVTAKNAAGESVRSNEAIATPRTTPTMPLNLQATRGDGQIALTWNAPVSDGGSPITNYEIHRGPVSGGQTFLIEIGNVLTYLDTGLTNGLTYYYIVAAANTAGQGPNSTEASATPMTTPTEPLGAQAAPGNGQVVLIWTAPVSDGGSPIINYEIYRGLSSSGETFLTEVGAAFIYTDSAVVNGQTYYYQVSARNVVGEGPRSNEASATPSAAIVPPSAPQNPTATAGDGAVALTWSPPLSDGGSLIINYRLYRGTASGVETFLAEIGNVLAYDDSTVTNDITYYYAVSAKNAAGEGPNSTEVSATPTALPANQPPACSISAPTPGATISDTYAVTGTASDQDGTVTYVEVKLDGGGWTQAVGTTIWSYQLNTSTLTDGQHTIYARSFDGTNFSTVVSVTVAVDNAVDLPPPEGKSILAEAWFWAVLIAVIVLVIALLLMLLSRRRRKKEQQTAREEDIPQDNKGGLEEEDTVGKHLAMDELLQ